MNIDKVRKRFIPMSETMLYILASLCKERHGYAIMQYVKDITNSRIILGAGTVYQSIGKLEKDGLIKAVREEERRKIYEITDVGKMILQEETTRIKEIYKNLEEMRCLE